MGNEKYLKSITIFYKISQKAGQWAIKVAFSLFDVWRVFFAVGNLLIS